jgi:hypothetical protein
VGRGRLRRRLDRGTGGGAAARQRSRLFRLERLVPPDPFPPGAAHLAGTGDRELLIAWHEAFGREAHTADPEHADRTVDDRLSHGGLTLWEAGGQPVAMAGSTRTVEGVVRVAGVYTVLFTDLTNPTSNALYQRLGYRPVEDRVVLELHQVWGGRSGVSQPGIAWPAVTAGPRLSS